MSFLVQKIIKNPILVSILDIILSFDSLSLSDILYMEADGNYLKLFTATEEYRFRDTISAVCNALSDSGFVRLHRGFLVNQAAVKLLGMEEAELINGSRIPIGRSYADTARKQLMRYMMQ